jgi:hypothetical protein
MTASRTATCLWFDRKADEAALNAFERETRAEIGDLWRRSSYGG